MHVDEFIWIGCGKFFSFLKLCTYLKCEFCAKWIKLGNLNWQFSNLDGQVFLAPIYTHDNPLALSSPFLTLLNYLKCEFCAKWVKLGNSEG